jgi:hypothetical protein
MDESVLGPLSLTCAGCQTPIVSNQGHWVARNPQSTYGAGYAVNHLMVPWLNIDDILNRQHAYDPIRFKNEVLGLPTELGDHLITRQEIEACCDDRSFAQNLSDVPAHGRRVLVAGLDWGGGGVSATVLVLGYIERNRVFRVVRFDRWLPGSEPKLVMEEIARRCAQFQVRFIGADGGGFGRSHNRLLFGCIKEIGWTAQMYSIFYSASDQAPAPEGVLWKWTVDRSATIGTLFGRIKKGLLRFPRAAECGTFLDEFTCEIAVYDEEMRSLRYSKPETLRDDALHATNYAELIGLRIPASALS